MKISIIFFLFLGLSQSIASETQAEDHDTASALLYSGIHIQQEGGDTIRSPYINNKGELVILEGHTTTSVSTDDNGTTYTMPSLAGELKIRKSPSDGRMKSMSYSIKDNTFANLGEDGKRSQFTDYQVVTEFDSNGKVTSYTSCESGDVSYGVLKTKVDRKCVTLSPEICSKFDEKRALFADINRCTQIYRDVKNFYSKNVKDTQSNNILKMVSELGDHFDASIPLEEATGSIANNPFLAFGQMQKIDSFCTWFNDQDLLSGGDKAIQLQTEGNESTTEDAE